MKGLERIAAERRHLIAAQVRCSTGFTWGRQQVEAGRAVVPLLRPRPAVVLSDDGAAGIAVRVARLARLLRGWPEGEVLPAPGELAAQAGMAPDHEPHVALQRLSRAFVALEEAGVLRTVAGGRDGYTRERLVLLRESGRVLRTARAPDHWLDAVRRLR